MAGLFLTWFYGDAMRHSFVFFRELIAAIGRFFSMNQLVRTLFAPWRHDIRDVTQLPATMWGQALIQNSVSRFIGFSLRTTTLVVGGLVTGVILLSALIFFIVWFFLPILLFVSVIYGFVLLGGPHA